MIKPNEINISVVVLEDCEAPDVRITFYMDRILPEEQEKYLQNVILSWYTVGAHGGFGGHFHNIDIVFDDKQTIYVEADLGSTPPDTLHILFTVITEALKLNEVTLEKIVVE